jgi:hypothetical protein
MRLGKLDYKDDPKTVRMASFFVPPKVPDEFDFDHGRTRLPIEAWGNFDWGDCVEVGKYHGLVRIERVETRHTVPVTESDVLMHYKAECAHANGIAPAAPGDPYDTGLVVLDALKDWRGNGLRVAAKPKNVYRIAAYGLLTPYDKAELRAACYGLHGIYFGINLPISAQAQINNGQAWDVDDGINGQPGSWGGHLVYAKKYDTGGFDCITWGREHYMTNAFIEKYADEVWAVVDDFDTAKKSKNLDVDGLIAYLRSIGANNIG